LLKSFSFSSKYFVFYFFTFEIAYKKRAKLQKIMEIYKKIIKNFVFLYENLYKDVRITN